jgi:amidase
MGLSGEPLSPQASSTCGEKRGSEIKASEIAAVNVLKRQYQKDYIDHWNSTKDISGTNRPVDAIISPVAPSAVAPHE